MFGHCSKDQYIRNIRAAGLQMGQKLSTWSENWKSSQDTDSESQRKRKLNYRLVAEEEETTCEQTVKNSKITKAF